MRNLATYIVAWLLAFAPAARAGGWLEWEQPTAVDATLLTLSEGSLAIDMMQTLDIKNHPPHYETNPILGQHPSDTHIIVYFGISMSLLAVGWYVTPTKLRPLWPIIILGMEIPTIIHNHSMGISLTF